MYLSWDDLPSNIKNSNVQIYYNILQKKKSNLFLKRFFDIIFSAILIILLIPIMIILSILITIDSNGGIIYKQKRVTQYGKIFYIYKFRTMVPNADKIGAGVTSANDSRITKIGKFLRKYRLDELPQIFNILKGELSFVGTRPEVPQYVEKYTDEMFATLLLPAGVTSLATIKFKDEDQMLNESDDDVESTYVNKILPLKMKINLEYIKKFNIFYDMKIIFMTIVKVFLK